MLFSVKCSPDYQVRMRSIYCDFIPLGLFAGNSLENIQFMFSYFKQGCCCCIYKDNVLKYGDGLLPDKRNLIIILQSM